MKSKIIRDKLVGIFLLSTLSLAVIIVSCSEENGISIGTTDRNNNNYQIGSGSSSYSLNYFFYQVGVGAAHEVGGELTGWVLGSMGLAGASPDYQSEINDILTDLDSIIVLLGNIDNELNLIEQTLLELNCSTQMSSLQTEIGQIGEIYDQYNSMIATASAGDTIPDTTMHDWADQVLAQGNHSANTSMGAILSTIEANVQSQSGAIYTCIQTIPLPPAGFGADTAYYNNVNSIVNYFYYYEAIGLDMLSEAYHYYAWYNAGKPGANDSLSSDSVQVVCSYNSKSLNDCNNVEVKTNEMYNSLLTQVTFGGAPYTDAYRLLQYNSNNSTVWTKSLEDFTSQANYNCSSPLTNNSPCGPAAGYYSSKLGDTVYRGSSGFSFANATDLDNLIDVNTAKNFSNNGSYLESIGFLNMAGKTIISTTVEDITLSYSNKKTPSVSFFSADMPPVTNSKNELVSVFMSGADFTYLLNPQVHKYSDCDGGNAEQEEWRYYYNTGFAGKDSAWIITYATSETCEYQSPSNFKFTDPTFSDGSSDYYPGYLQTAQDASTAPKRYLWPVLYSANAHCKTGYPPVNAGNMITKCGDDFIEFLTNIVPEPPTCQDTKILPVCTPP